MILRSVALITIMINCCLVLGKETCYPLHWLDFKQGPFKSNKQLYVALVQQNRMDSMIPQSIVSLLYLTTQYLSLRNSSIEPLESYLERLIDVNRKNFNEKPRIELRMGKAQISLNELMQNKSLNIEDFGWEDLDKFQFLQLGILFESTQEREIFHYFLQHNYSHCLGMSDYKLAGNTTIELGAHGIDKGNLTRFIQYNFDEVLKEMGYTPGLFLDVSKERGAIVSDADGTLWGKPTREDPEANNLSNAPGREELIRYLEYGGVFILNTGNDPIRTLRRFLIYNPTIPIHLLNRVLIGAAGGHVLYKIVTKASGQLNVIEIKNFRSKAFSLNDSFHRNVDLVYIGDDEKVTGNDMCAFQSVGQKQSILVSNHVGSALNVLPELFHLRGEEKAMPLILKAINQRIEDKINPFKNINKLIMQAKI